MLALGGRHFPCRGTGNDGIVRALPGSFQAQLAAGRYYITLRRTVLQRTVRTDRQAGRRIALQIQNKALHRPGGSWATLPDECGALAPDRRARLSAPGASCALTASSIIQDSGWSKHVTRLPSWD
jgi:hypothetical protein